jgi:transposase
MQRKNYPADFKAKVSLEAIREQRTMAELSGAFAVHSTMILLLGTLQRAATSTRAPPKMYPEIRLCSKQIA